MDSEAFWTFSFNELKSRVSCSSCSVASKGLAQTGQCQKMLEGPWGGAIGSSSEQKFPHPGQGAERNTSGACAERRRRETVLARRVDAHVIMKTPSRRPRHVQVHFLLRVGTWHRRHAQKNSKDSRSSFLRSDVHRTQGTPIYEKDSVSPAGMCRMLVTSIEPSG